MTIEPDVLAAIAVTRLGLGAREGEIATARSDPRGFLLAQIRSEGADQPQPGAPGSKDRLEDLGRYQQERKEAKSAGDPKSDPVKFAARLLRDDTGVDFLARMKLAATTGAGAGAGTGASASASAGAGACRTLGVVLRRGSGCRADGGGGCGLAPSPAAQVAYAGESRDARRRARACARARTCTRARAAAGSPAAAEQPPLQRHGRPRRPPPRALSLPRRVCGN